MSFYLFYHDLIDYVVSVSGLSCFPIILLITSIDVINFSFFNELLFKFNIHNLFISLHSSQQVIYVVSFSHSGV